MVSRETQGMGRDGKGIRGMSSGWNDATGSDNETKVGWNGVRWTIGRPSTAQTAV